MNKATPLDLSLSLAAASRAFATSPPPTLDTITPTGRTKGTR